MLLNSVDDYDVKTGTFTADFFLSLTSATPMPALNLQFPNGKIENKEVIADKPTFKLYRFSAPSNRRPISASIRSTRRSSRSSSRTTCAASTGALFCRQRAHAARARVPRPRLAGQLRRGALAQPVVPRPLRGRRSLLRPLHLHARPRTLRDERRVQGLRPRLRHRDHLALGMWVPPDEMEVRSNAGAPMLAGAVLFHYALIQELPATSYLTRADKLMLGVYISLALGMISTWWMFLVKEENMDIVFRVARIAVPVLSVVVMAFGCLA